ncbi:MAG: OmpA family protein [Bacteroidetes bacterium]|nr:OmpA family protein [Bacteroidota bacterium]
MSSKKYKLLLTVLMFLSVGAFAQKNPPSGYSVYDSTIITKKRQPQQNEFWNNNYNFPSKPRNMWEVGLSAGLFNVMGDVNGNVPTIGFSAHVRKALGYLFSLRVQYLNGVAKGLNWLASDGYQNNGPWVAAGYNGPVYYNYKTHVQDLGIQGILSLNNIRFHKNKSPWVAYAGAGIGATAYQAKLNLFNDNGDNYQALFSEVYTHPQTYKGRKDTRKALKAGMDDSYETNAQTNGERRPKMGSNTLRLSTTVLAGIEIKLSKRINLAIEDRHSFVHDDLLDGQQWGEKPGGDPAPTGNWDSYNYASIGLNINLGAKAVEPLWWINPLDYVYSELNNPKHQKFPKPVVDDTDGDGVVDQLDREPNTPAGCPVDTHGVTKDTDGDGVPDCKDKQLITPTECQPVDADGVGKCPEPDCCKNPPKPEVVNPCPTDYPSLSFKGVSANLTNDNKAMLHNVAEKLKANPTCNITINGYPETSKQSQALCQKRVEAIKKHLVEKEGISADRITTNCEVGGGDKNTVDIKSN